jgi:hypothetical protein
LNKENVVTVDINDLSKPTVESLETTPPQKRRGRPPKSLVESKKLGNRGAVGRPKGDAARVQELKARLLATTGNKVINKIVEIAMTDGHPVQGAALKMCLDRVLPTSLFEKDAKGQRNAVTINITGIGEAKVEQADIVDNDYTDVDYDEA